MILLPSPGSHGDRERRLRYLSKLSQGLGGKVINILGASAASLYESRVNPTPGLFRETGRVFRIPNELFAENSWIQVMLGRGIIPQHEAYVKQYCPAEG